MKRVNQWMYRGGRPNRLARIINGWMAKLHARGIAPNYMVTMEVRGRKSGRIVTMPLVLVTVDGERYLVSMLGKEVNWVRNVRAADGQVALRHGRTENVRLEEIPIEQRPPVLREYMRRAPSGRTHIPADKDTPVHELTGVAAGIPVFRVVAWDHSASDDTAHKTPGLGESGA